MYISLRVKILSMLFTAIAVLGFVFNESATRLIVEKTEEIFQERVETLLRSIRSYWESERNQVLRMATLYSESDKLVNYSVYGLTNLLQKEMNRLIANSGYFELRLHLKSGLTLSTRAAPTLGPGIAAPNPRMTLSRIELTVIGDKFILSAIVPVFKTEEFIGFLSLHRELDDNRARRMARNLLADVTIAVQDTIMATSLPARSRQDITQAITQKSDVPAHIFTLRMAGVLHSVGQVELAETVDKQPFRIYCTISQEGMLALVSQARSQTLKITLLALAVVMLISVFLTNRVLLARIRQVRDGARQLTQGDLSYRLAERGLDELGDLALSFNEMGAALLKGRDDIQQTIDRLETLKTYIQNILASLSTSVITFNRQGRVETANGAAYRELAGVCTPEPGLPFRKLFRVINRDSRRAFLKAARKLLDKGEEGVPFDVQFDLGSGGGVKVMETRFTFLRDADQKPYGMVMTLDDITQRRIIEKQLYHADKLSSIGQLAASVAHEIKNPLASIKTLGQLLQEETPGGDGRREYIDVIVSEVNRLNGVVEKLLTYARPEESQMRRIRFAELVTHVLALVDHEAGRHRVELAAEYPPELEILVDSEKIKQVLLNLIFNGIQAMPDGGNVTISASHVANSPWSVIRVTDTGTGMPADVAARVFEPFFTTKQRGTGLGLAIVKKIIDLHGGRIEVESRQAAVGTAAAGTTFTIYLPQERKEA